jgi:3-oxoacyl-[acyl-carrier-protein] synthase-3
MNKITAAITAVQGYVPDDILSNEDLSKLVDTSDEWITSRTGIKEKRNKMKKKGIEVHPKKKKLDRRKMS